MATSLTNIDQYLGGGFERIQYVLSTSGRPYGTLPAAGNVAGMNILYGANALAGSLPDAQILNFPGDNGNRGTIQFRGNESPQFTMTLTDFTGEFNDLIQGTLEDDAQSTYDFFLIDPQEKDFPDIFMLFTQRGVSTVAGEEGSGFVNVIFPLCSVTYTGNNGLNTGATATLHTYSISVNRVSLLPWGEPLTTGNHGATKASGFYFFSEQIPTFDIFRQDNTETSFTPTQTLNDNEQVIAWDGAALGTPSTLSVSVSTGDITFTAQANNNVTTALYEVA